VALAESAKLIAELSLDPSKFTRGVGQALGSVGRLESGLGRAGRGAGQLAGGLARAGTIIAGAAIAGLGGAAKAAIDFEDAFAGVVKTVDESELRAAGLSFDSLARTFRDMATEIPIAASEFARIGETAGALGIKAQDIDDFTKTVALLGVTTNLTSDQAAESLGKIGTILGLTGKEYEHFADVLVNLGNKGASTETEIIEISKRFAGNARQAGLATEAILALSSAAASLGIEPEAAGGALSRIFANMATNIALANSKGKAFAQVTGRSLKDLVGAIDRGEALGVFTDFLEGLRGLSRSEAALALKASGIVNVRDRDAILKMAQNLGFVNDQLQIATDSTGALGEEAQKRFDTVRSKITLLKNNLIEAGITIGEGFTPALGRAAEKLSEFLKSDRNSADLKKLGEDIGRTIDSVDWREVLDGARSFVDVLRVALDFAKGIFDQVSKLPTEVKAAGLGFLGLNKLSGGLIGSGIGNIVGGLTQSIVRSVGAQLPGIGRAFVQPVFVTNFPPGIGLGGAAGGAAAGAGGITAAAVAGVAASAAAVVGAAVVTQKLIVEPELQKQAGTNIVNTRALIARGDAKELTDAINGIKGDIDKLDPLKRALFELNADGVKTHTEGLIAALEGTLAKVTKTDQTVKALNAVRLEQQTGLASVARLSGEASEGVRAAAAKARVDSQAQVRESETTRTSLRTAIARDEAAARNSGIIAASAMGVAATRIVAAIFAARPVIQSTTVVNQTTVSNRYSQPPSRYRGNERL
jgi:TP901 family phage tail tape measure protein